jgi:hypothetical protein
MACTWFPHYVAAGNVIASRGCCSQQNRSLPVTLRLTLLLACLAIAACKAETGPPSNSQLPNGAPHAALQPGSSDFHATQNG